MPIPSEQQQQQQREAAEPQTRGGYVRDRGKR